MGGVLYLTGFEPFLGMHDNPTEALVRRLDSVRFGSVEIRGRVLPVTWADAPRLLEEELVGLSPVASLHLGVSGQSKTIHLERFAYNTMRSTFADNAGVERDGALIDDTRALETPLATPVEIDGLVERLTMRDVPAEISGDPGRYICNLAYYRALSLERAPALFMHVPHLDNRDPHGARWTIERLEEATRVVIEGLVEELES